MLSQTCVQPWGCSKINTAKNILGKEQSTESARGREEEEDEEMGRGRGKAKDTLKSREGGRQEGSKSVSFCRIYIETMNQCGFSDFRFIEPEILPIFLLFARENNHNNAISRAQSSLSQFKLPLKLLRGTLVHYFLGGAHNQMTHSNINDRKSPKIMNITRYYKYLHVINYHSSAACRVFFRKNTHSAHLLWTH